MNRNRCTLRESVPRAKCISGNQFTCHSFLTNCTLLPPENRFSICDNQLSAHCRFDNDRTNWDVTVRSQCSCPTIENILIVGRHTPRRDSPPVLRIVRSVAIGRVTPEQMHDNESRALTFSVRPAAGESLQIRTRPTQIARRHSNR